MKKHYDWPRLGSSETQRAEPYRIRPPDDRGNTDLHLAASRGDDDEVSQYINAAKMKAKYDHIDVKGLINAKNKSGETALYLANSTDIPGPDLEKRLKYNNVVKLLLENKAEPNITHQYRGTPLYHSIINRNPDTTSLLLQHNANPNLKNDYSKETPLHSAVLNYNHLEPLYFTQTPIIESLVRHGADTNVRDEYGNTPLDLAKKRNTNAVPILTEAIQKAKLDNTYNARKPLLELTHGLQYSNTDALENPAEKYLQSELAQREILGNIDDETKGGKFRKYKSYKLSKKYNKRNTKKNKIRRRSKRHHKK